MNLNPNPHLLRQAETFNFVYNGSDITAKARTGSGKTLGFALPILERMKAGVGTYKVADASKRGRAPVALVILPTRELAKQVAEDFKSIGGKVDCATVYGDDHHPSFRLVLYLMSLIRVTTVVWG